MESNVGQIVRRMNDSCDICSVSMGAGLFRWFLSFSGKSENDSKNGEPLHKSGGQW